MNFGAHNSREISNTGRVFGEKPKARFFQVFTIRMWFISFETYNMKARTMQGQNRADVATNVYFLMSTLALGAHWKLLKWVKVKIGSLKKVDDLGSLE